MNKNIRNIGIGLFLAGAAFQIESIITDVDITSTSTISQEAYDQAQQELADVKKQLAQLQLDLNSAQQSQTNDEGETAPAETSAPPKTSEKAITLSIQVGMTSSEISAKLEAAGIIQNNVDLDNYLSDQGLAGRIQVGNHELTSSMSLKQIAETITR